MGDKLRGVMERAPGEPTGTSTIWVKIARAGGAASPPTDCLGQSFALFRKGVWLKFHNSSGGRRAPPLTFSQKHQSAESFQVTPVKRCGQQRAADRVCFTAFLHTRIHTHTRTHGGVEFCSHGRRNKPGDDCFFSCSSFSRCFGGISCVQTEQV